MRLLREPAGAAGTLALAIRSAPMPRFCPRSHTAVDPSSEEFSDSVKREAVTGAVAPVGKGFGRPGRSGRKPKVFKEFCNDMLRDPAVQARLRDLAVNGAPDDAMRAINTAAKYSQPLPRQEIDQSSRLDAPSAEPPGRNGQPEFEVLIDDESVMGKEDEVRRRRPTRGQKRSV
jgi:hypothetical protein